MYTSIYVRDWYIRIFIELQIQNKSCLFADNLPLFPLIVIFAVPEVCKVFAGTGGVGSARPAASGATAALVQVSCTLSAIQPFFRPFTLTLLSLREYLIRFFYKYLQAKRVIYNFNIFYKTTV